MPILSSQRDTLLGSSVRDLIGMFECGKQDVLEIQRRPVFSMPRVRALSDFLQTGDPTGPMLVGTTAQ